MVKNISMTESEIKSFLNGDYDEEIMGFPGMMYKHYLQTSIQARHFLVDLKAEMEKLRETSDENLTPDDYLTLGDLLWNNLSVAAALYKKQQDEVVEWNDKEKKNETIEEA